MSWSHLEDLEIRSPNSTTRSRMTAAWEGRWGPSGTETCIVPLGPCTLLSWFTGTERGTTWVQVFKPGSQQSYRVQNCHQAGAQSVSFTPRLRDQEQPPACSPPDMGKVGTATPMQNTVQATPITCPVKSPSTQPLCPARPTLYSQCLCSPK